MKRLIQTATAKYQRVKAWYQRYERILMPVTLIGGFLVDYVTFTSINITLTFILLAAYWLLAGATIAFIHAYDAQKLPTSLRYGRLFAPLFIQFVFGSLLGPSLIFYWFSGAFSVSWPLMAIIALLMVFNEAFREAFVLPQVQLPVYFFITISLASIALPYAFTSLSAWLFVLAGAIAVAIFCPFVYFLTRTATYSKRQALEVYVAIAGVLLVMNALFFADLIPPIPLALREAGLYHTLTVSGGKYTMRGETDYFLQNIFGGQTVHLTAGEKLYVYSAIFAPAELQTTIVHHWQYYDETQKKWLSNNKLPFTINGGRQEGYKAYSFNSNLQPGRWRVRIENSRGQVLGNIPFTVERVQNPATLLETVR